MKKLNSISTYKFKNDLLLKTALTHTSYANEHGLESYERLEFLGDSILGFVTAEKLYNDETHYSEGTMTRKRANIVCEQTLKQAAKNLNIPNLIYISRGDEKTGGRNRDSVLADVVEAIIAAIYIDGGLEEAKKFIYENIYTLNISDSNPKSSLQEYAQRNGACDIKYVEISESGPDHDKTFNVAVYVNGEEVGTGRGKSKQLAEKDAAANAMKLWQDKI